MTTINKQLQPTQLLSNDAMNFDPFAQQDKNIETKNHQEQDEDDEQQSEQQQQQSDQDQYEKQIQKQIKHNNIKFTSKNDSQTQKQQLLYTQGHNSSNNNSELGKKSSKMYTNNQYTKFDSKICLNKISNMQKKQFIKQKKNKDKADRATVQQVLDQRTRKILLKFLKNQIIHEINGCLSTGKQANVYHSINNVTGKQYAIKIYKTSILVFKDRDRYVSGQFRFRRGYCSSNPRKMVAKWAQKQLRNLKRIEGTLPCPVGLAVKSNVLMMDFVGKDMQPAPKLRDIEGDIQKFSYVYLEVIQKMRILYQQCKLVHADLSQYNMLYWDNKVYIIDVSQSVQHDHPQSLDFLRRDIFNINEFFRKKKVQVFRDWNVFQFIVALGIQKGKQKQQLERIVEEFIAQEEQNKNKQSNENGQQIKKKTEQEIQDLIFKRITIPRLLGNLSIQKVQKQIFQKPYNESKFMQAVTGVQKDYRTDKYQQGQEEQLLLRATMIKQVQGQDDHSSSSSSSSDSDSSDDEQQKKKQGESVTQTPQDQQSKKGGKQKYQGLSKVQRKHKVKQEKRQKRKQKIPKSQKTSQLKRNDKL